MQRYFLEESYDASQGEPLKLTGDDFHHAAHVMRMKVSDKCYLVFRDSVAVVAEVTEIGAEAILLKEIEKETQEKELPIAITIACGYTKGDKLDLVVQKGTEMGASHFVGFPGQTSVVKWDGKKLAKRQERLTKIAKEAAEQSHRHAQPTVTLYEKAKEFEAVFSDYDAILIAYEESAKQGEAGELVKTFKTIQPNQRLLVIFGPEGGLSPNEIETFQALGGKVCALGPRILRAETAPLYLLGAASYHFDLLV